MSKQEQLEGIIRLFFEPETTPEAKAIGAGNINDTYRIAFQAGGGPQSWLLQRLNHQVFTDPDAVMHNISTVAEHLSRQADFPLRIPAPVAGLDGRLLQRDVAGNYWRVFPFYEQTYAPERLPDPDVAYEAARAYGIFLHALRDCPAAEIRDTIPGFHDTDRRWAAFHLVLEQDPAGRVKAAQAEIETLYRAKPVFDRISKLKSAGALPRRITHNDTKAGNVLLDTRSGHAVAVIDWDTIMPGTVLSDFGDMVRTFAPDCPEDDPGALQLRLEVLEALCSGFLEPTSGLLSENERLHLPLGALWITGEQALRFLSDYLAGDVYYKVRTPEHNLVRARNQLALFCALQDNLAELEKMVGTPQGNVPTRRYRL